MERADLQQQLRRLSRAHPGEHPYSLALRVQVETAASSQASWPSSSLRCSALNGPDGP